MECCTFFTRVERLSSFPLSAFFHDLPPVLAARELPGSRLIDDELLTITVSERVCVCASKCVMLYERWRASYRCCSRGVNMSAGVEVDATSDELKSHRRSPMTNGRVSLTPIDE